MNSQVASAHRELRFNSDPDWPELPRIGGTQGLHRPEAIATGGERRAGARTMAIGVLTVGATADSIEVLRGLAWGFQTQAPDEIARTC